MNLLTQFENTLKLHQLSVTKPRLKVFEILEQHGLLTMNDLIKACADIDRASVYRTVESLETIHVLHKVYSGFKYKLELSDPFSPHHHHIVCTRCKKAQDISKDRLETILSIIAKENNYVLYGHVVELTGLCSDCREI
jgi:Fur family transcriptional regulator, ferric uptake regulator